MKTKNNGRGSWQQTSDGRASWVGAAPWESPAENRQPDKSRKSNTGIFIGILSGVLAAAAVFIVLLVTGVLRIGGAETPAVEVTAEPTVSAAGAEEEKAYVPQIGDTITFGTYEQDGDASNGAEPIEWRVLDVDADGNVFVVSEYGLDAVPYNERYADITWEACTLRSWLNDDFYNAAFSSEEQTVILTISVVNDDNPEFGTEGGNDTQDKIFLLSLDEAEEYFADDEDRMCVPTAYALPQGACTNDSYTVNGTAACWWWLRSPGISGDWAECVGYGGWLYNTDSSLLHEDICVRPAMWIASGG